MVVLAFVAAAMGQFVGMAIVLTPLWRGGDFHWTERARRGWSARLVAAAPLSLFIISFLGSGAGLTNPVSFLLPAATFFGAVVGTIPGLRAVLRRRVTLRSLLGEYVVAFSLRTPATIVFLAMFLLLLWRSWDVETVEIMGLSLLLALLLSLGAAVPLVRLLGLLTAPSERLITIVQRAAAQTGVQPPPVFVLHWQAANAIAFPFARFVAFTPSIIELLSDDELTAVAAHEIAHLSESRAQKLIRLSGVLVIFPLFALPVLIRRFEVLGFILPFTMAVAGGRFLRAFAQKLERRADAAAHSEAEQGAALATALEKLYEFNLVPAIMPGKRQIHPHLYDRMLAAGLQPTYPRPAPPRRWLALLGGIVSATISLSPLALSEGPIGQWVDHQVNVHRRHWSD